MSDGPQPRKRRPVTKPESSGSALWLKGLGILGLIVLMVWVTDRFIENDKLTRCLTSGHRDCGQPIEPIK